MPNNSIERTAKELIYILSCGIDQTEPDKERVDQMDLDVVFELASKHMLKSAVAVSLESAGVKNELTASAIVNSVRRDCFFEKAWSEISEKLEAAGILYLPLKGAVLKDYYSKSHNA